jgi:hypothetical protein
MAENLLAAVEAAEEQDDEQAKEEGEVRESLINEAKLAFDNDWQDFQENNNAQGGSGEKATKPYGRGKNPAGWTTEEDEEVLRLFNVEGLSNQQRADQFNATFAGNAPRSADAIRIRHRVLRRRAPSNSLDKTKPKPKGGRRDGDGSAGAGAPIAAWAGGSV